MSPQHDLATVVIAVVRTLVVRAWVLPLTRQYERVESAASSHGTNGIVAVSRGLWVRIINYLAHLYLAGSDSADLAGALLGDFVKGQLHILADQFPPRVLSGIRLHRAIDQFTDAHACWRTSRARFSPSTRRFAGVAVDMLYDHFLARHWTRFHDLPLAVFSGHAYQAIEEYESLFPPRLRRLFPYMRDEDWLTNYQHFAQIDMALTRMATRSERLAPLAQTVPEALRLYQDLECDFVQFFPDLVDYARDRRQDSTVESGKPA